MKSSIRYIIGIAMIFFNLCYIALSAQTERIHYRLCNNCYGANPTLGDTIAYTTNQIISDYGMRNAGKGASKFHKGIDFAPPKNFLNTK